MVPKYIKREAIDLIGMNINSHFTHFRPFVNKFQCCESIKNRCSVLRDKASPVPQANSVTCTTTSGVIDKLETLRSIFGQKSMLGRYLFVHR
uniref:Putative ovule protein n=1 Tax=Solanum chacoense TaxID=4108 RepID=A0A0V0GP23_SOLCH